MELEYIKSLAELMDVHGLSELEVQNGEDRVVLSKKAGPWGASLPAPAAQASGTATEPPPTPAADEKNMVNAPFVGCVYLTASPGQPPFVTPGASVKKGQILCIIEAMKVMNELPAPRDGVVAEICVENEQLVEFGQPLFCLQ